MVHKQACHKRTCAGQHALLQGERMRLRVSLHMTSGGCHTGHLRRPIGDTTSALTWGQDHAGVPATTRSAYQLPLSCAGCPHQEHHASQHLHWLHVQDYGQACRR